MPSANYLCLLLRLSNVRLAGPHDDILDIVTSQALYAIVKDSVATSHQPGQIWLQGFAHPVILLLENVPRYAFGADLMSNAATCKECIGHCFLFASILFVEDRQGATPITRQEEELLTSGLTASDAQDIAAWWCAQCMAGRASF